ncbi:FAD:protein FMN transferase [Undibacterium sp.]|uniref:FAD:protein FMN transferase n=1 Tax=Undibacterium sp. TaxID=1914977 RepID=UPI0025F83531|nr:FAD:protein FMN transferase [Undibacterium sp.]
MKRRAQPWLGTLVEISIGDELSEAALNRAFQAAFSVLAQIHMLMSYQYHDSDVSHINDAPVGARLVIHPHTYQVIKAALQLAELSAGLFDIRVAANLVAWEYLPHRLDSPPALAYQAQQQAWRLMSNNRIEKQRLDLLDLGGIAKGYAVDQAILALQQAGVQNACVNAGGDLRVIGDEAIEVAIRDPHAPAKMAQTILLKNQAMATSGSYFSARMHAQQQVSALVHGRTGAPLIAVGSVSVRAPLCIWADALTKVVAASSDAQHPSLTNFAADAFIIEA